jgi:mannose/cellobiose epimerase-like protein (N-acyl-D-glucosamine 2-epimerase family)
MLETAHLIDKTMRHPTTGFWHQLPPNGPRIQNPHMHLLEACLVCFESTNEPVFERLAKEVISLFDDHFYNHDSQTLCEYFEDDLNPMAGPKGEIVEPGHQFEWAWILASAAKLFGLDLSAQAKGLVHFGEAWGVDHNNGACFNVVNKDGVGIDQGSRTWPNTERLKAGVALFEMFGHDTKPMIAPTLDLLFARYLTREPAGGWIDAFDASGAPIAIAMPTSTFYHLYLAFAEVLRVADALNSLTHD